MSTKDVTKLVGCTYRQLDLWLRDYRVLPGIWSEGSGNVRRFADRDVEAVWACVQISRRISRHHPNGQTAGLMAAACRRVAERPVTVGEHLALLGDGSVRRLEGDGWLPFLLEAAAEGPVVVVRLRSFDEIVGLRAGAWA